MNPLLQINQLDIGYPGNTNESNTVLSDIDIQINAGELVCLLGANGTGKSTLLRTVAGLQPSLNGEIHIGNSNLKDLRANQLAQKISVVLTDSINVDRLTVYNLVSLGRFPHTTWLGKQSTEDKEKIDEAVKLVKIGHLTHRNISELSDGERQKALIAKALAQDTPLILLDEPTAFLDLPHRTEILHLLRNLSHEKGKGILLSIHDLDLALKISDRIILLSKEKEIFKGIPEDLVLNGSFNKCFDKDGVNFDPSTGSFKIDQKFTQQVALEGNGNARIWTERALNRVGIEVISNPSTKIVINETQEGVEWKLNDDGQVSTFTNIKELLLELKK